MILSFEVDQPQSLNQTVLSSLEKVIHNDPFGSLSEVSLEPESVERFAGAVPARCWRRPWLARFV